MEPNIVILAGGIASRMKSCDATVPAIDPSLRRQALERSKAMLGIGANERPFLDYLLHNIVQAGYTRIVIVVSERDASIRSYYETEGGAGQFPKAALSYVEQPIPEGRRKPIGTADALVRALRATPEWRGQHFTVCNSDNLYSVRALKLLLADPHSNATIEYDLESLRFGRERIQQFAVLKKDAYGFLQDIVEKPTAEEIAHMRDAGGRIGVSMNIFKFSYDEVFPFLERVPLHPDRQEKELPNAVKLLVQDVARSVFVIPLSEHVIDLTSQHDIPSVQEYLRQEFPDF